MSDDRVEQPVPLTRCWLCARTHSIDALQALQARHLPTPVLQCVLERYGRTATPVICTACEVFITTATTNAAKACDSDVGQQLLRCAEAFAARDYQGRPVDGLGQWHYGVATQRTCRWEPWHGSTAEATEVAVAECTGQPHTQVHRVFETYRVNMPGRRDKTRAAQPVCRRKQRRISTARPAAISLAAAAQASHDPTSLGLTETMASAAQPSPARVPEIEIHNNTARPNVAQPGLSQTLQSMCVEYKIPAFQRPFFLLMIAKVLPVQWGDQAELLLRRSWSTAWGGGKVVNALLFNAERIVPETADDIRSNAWDQCYYQSCRANELFACILHHSEFGDRLLRIGCEHVPAQMRRPIFNLQRFCYKICELRKANHSRRHVYYRLFHTVPARQKWLQRLHDQREVVVSPLW